MYYGIMASLIVGAYILGNVNFSIILSKIKRMDVRSVGSKNPGTMNMLRSFGIGLGALTLILDALKGSIPSILGWWLLGKTQMFEFGSDKIGLFLGGISATLGHCFPIVYKFKGGKGVATTIGVALVASPIVALIGFLIAVIFFFTVKIGALSSFIATGIPLIYVSVNSFVNSEFLVGALAIILYVLVLAMHHANIVRILKGEEKQVIMFGKNKSATAIQRENAEKSSKISDENNFDELNSN